MLMCLYTPISPNEHGLLALHVDEDGEPLCIGCLLCETVYCMHGWTLHLTMTYSSHVAWIMYSLIVCLLLCAYAYSTISQLFSCAAHVTPHMVGISSSIVRSCIAQIARG